MDQLLTVFVYKFSQITTTKSAWLFDNNLLIISLLFTFAIWHIRKNHSPKAVTIATFIASFTLLASSMQVSGILLATLGFIAFNELLIRFRQKILKFWLVALVSLITLYIGLKLIAPEYRYWTFGGLGYLLIKSIEIHKHRTSFLERLTYISFWLPFFGGPMYRLSSFKADIEGDSIGDWRGSFNRFALGSIKIIILGPFFASLAGYLRSSEELGPIAGIFIFANFFRVYAEFSGYTDCIIALGKLIGINFPENFNQPLTSVSLTDFWNRWHMSLTHWLRDNVFFPLTYKLMKQQKSDFFVYTASYGSVSFAMALIHGVTPNWWLYGLWNFFGFSFDYFLNRRLSIKSYTKKWHQIVQRIYVITFVSIGFLLMEDFEEFYNFLRILTL